MNRSGRRRGAGAGEEAPAKEAGGGGRGGRGRRGAEAQSNFFADSI